MFYFFLVQASLKFTLYYLKMRLYKGSLLASSMARLSVHLQNGFVARLSQVHQPGNIYLPLL